MVKIEDQCVDCQLPCLGSTCPYKNVEVHYCDNCKSKDAVYRYEDVELCYCCFEQALSEIYKQLSLEEKADALNVDYEVLL